MKTTITDLADNRPGECVRMKVRQLTQESPILTRLARILNSESSVDSWRKGLRGERKVASMLNTLGSDWRVLHSIPIGQRAADLDHLVIGPGGVYSLNTKNHAKRNVWVTRDEFIVNGIVRNYANLSRIEGERSSRLLSNACGFRVNVQPIIVVIAHNLAIFDLPAQVVVLEKQRVISWIEREPQRLSKERIDKIFDAARYRSTWTS